MQTKFGQHRSGACFPEFLVPFGVTGFLVNFPVAFLWNPMGTRVWDVLKQKILSLLWTCWELQILYHRRFESIQPRVDENLVGEKVDERLCRTSMKFKTQKERKNYISQLNLFQVIQFVTF